MATEVARRVESFMDEIVILLSREALASDDVIPMSEIEELWDLARERDLFAPQIPEEYGGQGLAFRDMLPSFEQLGRSLIGALSIRANAPQEGNTHTLEKVSTEDQKERWFRPLVQGDVSSAFSMTEPARGRIGSEDAPDDGSEGRRRVGHQRPQVVDVVRNGRGLPPRDGADGLRRTSLRGEFDYPRTDRYGRVDVVRNIPHMGADITDRVGGHAEIKYENVRVPVENTIGEEGEGFRVAQLRLGGGRLTHCMRYSGMAQRALDIAKAYLSEREGFGEPLADKQALRHRVADAETRLHAARTMIRHAARELDRSDARIEVAMAKTFTANVTSDVIDLALQCCGANGIGKDLPIAHFYEEVRKFRIVDGADEVHRRSIARWAFEDVSSEELEHVLRFDPDLLVEPDESH